VETRRGRDAERRHGREAAGAQASAAVRQRDRGDGQGGKEASPEAGREALACGGGARARYRLRRRVFGFFAEPVRNALAYESSKRYHVEAV